MTFYTICIDPGFVDEAFGVVIFKEDEEEEIKKTIIFAEGFSLVSGTLATAKRNERFHLSICSSVESVLDLAATFIKEDAKMEEEEIDIRITVEHQMENKKHGHDLVWLTGVVMGIAAKKNWYINKLRRNMDCCRRLGIPVAKDKISRDAKKRATLRKVWELGFKEIKSYHLADAAILYLS